MRYIPWGREAVGEGAAEASYYKANALLQRKELAFIDSNNLCPLRSARSSILMLSPNQAHMSVIAQKSYH